MGWLYMQRGSLGGHASASAYLDAQFTYERALDDGGTTGLRVLASSCPQNRVYYAAAQVMTNRQGGEIIAIICLVRWNPHDREGLVFGYKDMTENMGPYEAECPAAILDLLTATENAHALDWRRRCRASLERKSRKLADGDRIRLSATITFADGHEGSEFLVERRGRRTVLRDPTSGRGYRISRLMQRDWTIVPVTRVHKTRFC